MSVEERLYEVTIAFKTGVGQTGVLQRQYQMTEEMRKRLAKDFTHRPSTTDPARSSGSYPAKEGAKDILLIVRFADILYIA